MRCGQRGQWHSFVKQGKVVPFHLKCTRHPLKPLLSILSKGKGMWFDSTFKFPLAACCVEKQRHPPPTSSVKSLLKLSRIGSISCIHNKTLALGEQGNKFGSVTSQRKLECGLPTPLATLSPLMPG